MDSSDGTVWMHIDRFMCNSVSFLHEKVYNTSMSNNATVKGY